MKKILIFALVSISFQLISCSGEDSNIEVTVPTTTLPIIPASTTSCIGRINETINDISASYFRIPYLTITRKNTSKVLNIAVIRLTADTPGNQVKCSFGGESLLALSGNWWAAQNAIITAGTSTFTIDCAMICGGVNSDKAYIASGVVEVLGFEQDPVTNEETPVKLRQNFSVQSF